MARIRLARTRSQRKNNPVAEKATPAEEKKVIQEEKKRLQYTILTQDQFDAIPTIAYSDDPAIKLKIYSKSQLPALLIDAANNKRFWVSIVDGSVDKFAMKLGDSGYALSVGNHNTRQALVDSGLSDYYKPSNDVDSSFNDQESALINDNPLQFAATATNQDARDNTNVQVCFVELKLIEGKQDVEISQIQGESGEASRKRVREEEVQDDHNVRTRKD